MIPSPVLMSHNTNTMQPWMWGAVSSPVTGTIQAKASASAAAGPHNSMNNLLFVVVLFRAWVEGERGEEKKNPICRRSEPFCVSITKTLPAGTWEMPLQVKNTIKVLAKKAPLHVLHYLREASVKIRYSHDKKEFQTKQQKKTKHKNGGLAPFFFQNTAKKLDACSLQLTPSNKTNKPPIGHLHLYGNEGMSMNK